MSSKKLIKYIAIIYVISLIVVPLIFTISNVVDNQFNPPDIAVGSEKTEQKPYVCIYNEFPKQTQYEYCDQKEFISNLTNYKFQLLMNALIYFVSTLIILLIIGVWFGISTIIHKKITFNKST